MGGEMAFFHNNKPIENLDKYEKLVKEMEIDCKKTKIPVTSKPISTWKENESIKRKLNFRFGDKLGADDDYFIGIDLGRSTRNPDNHYYILFPKNPNTLKVESDMHARGLQSVVEYDSKRWIEPWLIKFVVEFPGVFELYYGDGHSGYSEIGEIQYFGGRNYPLKKVYGPYDLNAAVFHHCHFVTWVLILDDEISDDEY